MKILIISSKYLPVPAIDGGAVENLIYNILEENDIDDRNNIDVISVSNGHKIINNNLKYSNIKYINNKSFFYKIINRSLTIINKCSKKYYKDAFLLKIIKILKFNNNYDYIIIENEPEYVPIINKYKKSFSKIILHLHNDRLNDNTKLFNEIIEESYRIITVSDFLSNIIKKNYKTNKNISKKIITVYNGINIEKFSQKLNKNEILELRNKYCIKKNDFVFLYIGRFIKEKGVYELVDTFIRTFKETNIKLLIVGGNSKNNNNYSDYMKEVIKLAKNNNNIIFTGFVENKYLFKYISISDIQVIPSIWNEPLGLVVLEGMASSIPLIVNDVGGIPELVDSNSALICDHTNFINDLSKNMKYAVINKEKLMNIKKNSFINSKKYTVENFYKKFMNSIK